MRLPLVENVTPIPGILNFVILLLPRVISFDTVAEEACAPEPITISLLPLVTNLPVSLPMKTFEDPFNNASPARSPSAVL